MFARQSVLLALGASLSFVAPQSAFAQSAPTPPPAASLRDDDPLAGISLALDVSEGESKASASLSGLLKKPSLADMAEPGRRESLGYKFSISVPVGGGDDVLDKATLDKLGGGTKFSGSVTFLSYNSDPTRLGSPAFIGLMNSAKAACELKAKTEPEQAACNYFGPSPDYILTHTPSARLAMNRALYSGYWSGGLKGSVSLNRYKWVDAGTLLANQSNPTAYSATLWAVYYPADAVSAWKLEGEYSSASEQADPEIICKTVVVVAKDDCVSAAPTAPIRKQAFVVRGEYRRFFPFAKGKGGIGVAVTGSVDTTNGDYGFEVPVFLALPGTSDIMPGIKVGYGSKDDEVTISLFIKTAFSL